MKIVIDTNILFSALLNINSNIGNLILNGSQFFEFYSINFMLFEINKHYDKLLKLTKLQKTELDELMKILIGKIHFYDDSTIPIECREKAFYLVKDIDLNDLYFVALSEHINAKLWTGDRKLIDGLQANKYSNLLTTKEIIELYLDFKVNFKN